MQECFDTLYAQSVSGHHFYDLTELMSSKTIYVLPTEILKEIQVAKLRE